MQKNKVVAFAYHSVGVRCLSTLIENGFNIDLVITHEDSTHENIWFDSVSELCQKHNIKHLCPTDLSDPSLLKTLENLAPDYIFSFYYRLMIPNALLSCAKIAALNMHGSLLPKYRGRVPINWAVLHGETKTGATLHIMESKPDAGDIVSQKTVAIDPDETAFEVFKNVTEAASLALLDVIPDLLQGNVPRRPNRLQEGSYFGGRKPEDGRIDWEQPAQQVYNLIRAVAPPYPGAFTEINAHRLVIAQARLASLPYSQTKYSLGLQVVDNRIYGFCGDGRAIMILRLEMNDLDISPETLQKSILSPLIQ
jgi:methionyl-tRNA formyltransferase